MSELILRVSGWKLSSLVIFNENTSEPLGEILEKQCPTHPKSLMQEV